MPTIVRIPYLDPTGINFDESISPPFGTHIIRTENNTPFSVLSAMSISLNFKALRPLSILGPKTILSPLWVKFNPFPKKAKFLQAKFFYLTSKSVGEQSKFPI